MCEYQIIVNSAPPICKKTNHLCTFCIFGNNKTYNADIQEAYQRVKEYKGHG